MPAKTWAGSYTTGTKTWNSNANWSPSGIPQAGDDVTVAGNTTTTGFVDFSMVVGTSADILAIASLTIGDTTPAVQATYTLTSGGDSTKGWAFGSGSVDLTANGGPVGLGCKMQGSGTIVKKGTGDVYAFGAWSNLATWTGPIDLQAGQLGVDSFDNKLGAGKISMTVGTGLYNLAATTRQIANAVDVNGSVDLNKYASRGQLTINGTVTIANTSGITVTNTSAVALAAATALSAPAGFTRAGSASFTVSGTFNSGALFTNSGSGTVTLSGGTVTLTGGVAHSGTDALTFSGNNINIGGTFTTSGSAGNVILGTGTGITLNAVSHGGAGTLTFSGTDVTLNGTLTTSGTAGAVTFSGTRFALKSGFTHGSSNTLSFTGTKSTTGSAGAATITSGSGIVYIGAAATGDANQLAGMTSFAVNGTGRLAYRGANTYAETATFTGTGIVESHNASSAGINLTGATLTDFTGTVRCYLGIAVATSVQTLGSLNAAATLGVFSEAGGSGAREATQKFPNSGTYANPISIANAYTTGITYTIQANNTSAATTFSGAITKTNVAAAPATLALGGISSQATASGNISSDGGTLNVSVIAGAAWTLSGNNTYGGTTTITTGTLRAASNTAFGAQGGGVILASGQRLELIGGITLNKATADTALQGGTVYNVSGANTYNGATSPLTGAATTFEVAAGSLTWKPLISGAFGLTIKGPGSFKLDNIDSTYTGVTSVTTACTLEVTKLANVDVASSLGKPLSANANIKFVTGSTLLHTGTTADSTDRNIELTTAGTLTIDSSGTGSGAVTLAAAGGAFVLPAGANALVFTGTNSASNTCARTIANSTSATSLTKNGTNTWILSGTLTHEGTTTLTAGVLDLGSTPRTGLSTAFIISGGTLQNGTASVGTTQIIATGGTIKAPLTGTTTLTINSGSTVRMEPNVPTTGSNEQTGAIAVTAGAVVDLVGPNDVNVATIGSGKMLGNGAVTCAGTIRTKHSSSSTQRGQARYKSLTLTAGARLEIGAVAA